MVDEEKDLAKLNRTKRWFYLVWTVVGCIGLLVLLSYALNILALPVAMLVWTVIIVFCLRNLVAFLEKRGINRFAGTTIAYVVMAIVLAVVALLMLSPTIGLSSQFISLINDAPRYFSDLSAWVNELYSKYSYVLNDEMFKEYLQDIISALSSAAQDVAKQSAQGVVAFSSGVANTLMAIGFAFVVAFWILMELPAIGRECNRLIAGNRHEEDFRLFHVTVTRVMAGYIKATLLQCVIIAIACGILYAILGVPNSAAVALITGVLNIIPVVGPWIGGVMAALLGLAASPLMSLIVFIGTVIIQQIVYTFVGPRLMENSVDIHPALTLICLLIGSSLGTVMSGLPGSILGMLIAVPAAAVLKSVFVYYFEKNTGNQLVAEDGVFFKGTPSEGEDVDPIADAAAPHPESTARFERIRPESIEARLSKADRQHDKNAKGAAHASDNSLHERLMSLHIPVENGTEDRTNGTIGSASGEGDPTDNDRTDR
jgi:predicted PurR-regulated permease PerM